MVEIRLTIIKTGTNATQDKHVTVHISDADVVLQKVADGTGPLKSAAPALAQTITTILANCSDTDKLEINAEGGILHKGDGSGQKIAFK